MKKPLPDPIETIVNNEWTWDYLRFLRETGLRADSYADSQWQHFKRAGAALRQINPSVLLTITGRGIPDAERAALSPPKS